MVRRYKRYSRRRRYYRSKKRWTPYNSDIVLAQPANLTNDYVREIGVNAIFGASNSLGNYAAASDALSAVNYYVCRCRFKGVFVTPMSSGVSYVVYLCYIPNAVTIDDNPRQSQNLREAYFYLHPEYILAWTRMDYISNTGDTGEISLYSRITKRLSPGDRIGLYILARNTATEAKTLSAVQGTFSCYLRTN